ncbi:MerR family transcriptional regulator [Pseudonocardia spinosispora]|uniref:MerR family transcriptional regulator n=1 Tax=Pseudonocardia spinosispora TaxID=103441 RepID=UPI0003F5F085|nr:MerR family transcriptional regulator [Pseudonocardia spinosispora]
MTHASTEAPNADPLLTVDQLAGRTGVSVRTIRFYAGKGLLPPPMLRGRVGLYGPDHLARLELVAELSGLGFTLAAIEGYLARLPESVGAETLMLQRALLTPWIPESLDEITLDELHERAGRILSDDEVTSLEVLGTIERRDDTVILHGAATLTPTLALLDLGYPPETLRRSHELITKHTSALADGLMELFQEEVLQPYRDRGKPASERTRMREMLLRIKPLTVQGVMTAFGRAVNRNIRERFAERP